MLSLQQITYKHPNKELLFSNLNLTVNPYEKIALIGNNGIGKSTLFKIITGEVIPSTGHLQLNAKPYYIPQIFGQYNHCSVAEALGVNHKLNALLEILNGNANNEYFETLDNDWTIEQRSLEALDSWELQDIDLQQPMASLSGGQKTKVFLAGINIYNPQFILLDEPSNHLDANGRQLLYQFIRRTKSTLLITSHDRQLLNLLNAIYELSPQGISVYGGNYDFYIAQKQIAKNALEQDINTKEKALRKAKEKEREALERQQKQDAKGKKKQEKAGVARIMMNTLRNNAEKSTSKTKEVHAEKVSGTAQELSTLRGQLPDAAKMKFGFNASQLHQGKVLFEANGINYRYAQQMLWKENLDFRIASGERVAIKGSNGSGKTTLIHLLLGNAKTSTGKLQSTEINAIYIDQDYSLINPLLNVYEQAQHFNLGTLQEHEVKTRLTRFLFGKEDWDKPCSSLSGGERMRLMLCCLTLGTHAPDLIVLDEPTNNLDIQNVEILTTAINEYQGTLLVVSHDACFLEQINIQREIRLG
ncbi:ABC-F family ATP-binding cassette domain-containing protein [Pedobacter nanyangensis]|uniref:ABC-F family ATP-binding cassette domain-containing protein n=1 Tax=Pedobacter nanyangensis TaxID=1562389 RepID=UPI000DE36AE3|nr:ABC-F family ATP-binding cassette domain-containing protein [Pedobacter nanyangensis]